MTKQDVIDHRDFLKTLVTQARLATLLEARILFTIGAAEKELSVNELAEAIDAPLSTISRVLFNLSEMKLVEYHDDPKDRRRKTLTANLKRLNGAAPAKK